MDRLHEEWPLYGFDRHKGYPTADHLKALEAHGLSPHHRLSFAPCAKLRQLPLF
jgi:ribonuclease HII